MPTAALQRFSTYDDTQYIGQQVRSGQHREVVGGLWDELGDLQRDFLIGHGLLPHHSLVDIGAGSFRAGVKLIPYLDPGKYCATDSQLYLLEAGYVREIEPAKLHTRFPRGNFLHNADFQLAGFERFFDYGLAQSVFTHMPLSRLQACLGAIGPYFRTGALVFVTVFLGNEQAPEQPVTQVPGIITHPNQDPYHTTLAALATLSAASPQWRMTFLGDWSHPRNQKMVQFERL
jgi:hypothetical protein